MEIAIIGCGNIGLRHFQSIIKSDIKGNIILVDSNRSTLSKFESSNSNLSIIKHYSVEEIKTNLDVAIIATTSGPRKKLIQLLLLNNSVRYLILEKFLFNKFEDYEFINKLFKKNKKTDVWVNQWMSSEKHFIKVADFFSNASSIEMSVTGSNWGMCCNCVHYIDYFHYLSGRTKLYLTNVDLDNQIIKSKREGYYELFGYIEIKSENGNTLKLECSNSKSYSVNYQSKLKISSGFKRFDGVYSLGKLECRFKNKSQSWKKEYKLQLQSQMTELIIQSLIKSRKCGLPRYSDSLLHHTLVINHFKNKFEENGFNVSMGVPIT